jgi:hypothetical protein
MRCREHELRIYRSANIIFTKASFLHHLYINTHANSTTKYILSTNSLEMTSTNDLSTPPRKYLQHESMRAREEYDEEEGCLSRIKSISKYDDNVELEERNALR